MTHTKLHWRIVGLLALIALVLANVGGAGFAPNAHAHEPRDYDTVLVEFVDGVGLPAIVVTLWECDAILHHTLPIAGAASWEIAVEPGTTDAAVACFTASPNVVFAEPDFIGDLDGGGNNGGGPRSADNVVLVKFVDGIDATTREDIIKKCKGLPQFSGPISGTDAWIVAIPPGQVDSTILCLEASPDVEYAEPDYLGELDSATPVAVAPNDPCYDNIPNDDCLDETQYAPQKIRANMAWEVTTGDSSILIAVMDSGIRADHPDLQGKFVVGYDYGEDDDDVTDTDGHGTQVSGVAAAATGNGQGIAGIGHDSKVLTVKVTRTDANGQTVISSSDLTAGIYFAINNGADIINMSLGFSSSSLTLGKAVADAWDAGLILVASSGNTGQTAVRYPAGYAQVIGVASIDENEAVASSSTCGAHVAVAAPGVKILASDLPYEPFTGWTTWYSPRSGTSMAAPHVSGLAALILAENPHLTNTEARSVIEHTAVDIGASGPDICSGAGRIDAYPSVLFDYTTLPADGFAHASHLLSPDGNNDGSPDLFIGSSLTEHDGIDTIEDYDGSGSYSLEIKVTNQGVEPAQLVGWIDFNQDGLFANDFESGERSSPPSGDLDRFENANVPPGYDGTVKLTWSGNSVGALLPDSKLDLGLRLRLTTDSAFFTNASPQPSGLALGGDIDDGNISVTTSGFGPLAVTLGYFQAEATGEEVTVRWQTLTESGVAGFNLLVDIDGSLIQLNDELIASPVIDSVMPTGYERDIATPATTFYLEEVRIDGTVDRYGPFDLGTAFGTLGPDETGSQSMDRSIYLPFAISQ